MRAKETEMAEVDSLAVALSKILYPLAHDHPANDTATMLLDVDVLKECQCCDAPVHVKVCKQHLDQALIAVGETLSGDEQLFAAGETGQYVAARLVRKHGLGVAALTEGAMPEDKLTDEQA
jgi:hypothetical protein